jgi:SAM-dependent methyltransferase
MSDPRAGFAAYYDLNPSYPDDVPFYLARIPSADAAVLELGCGTGRVSVPLALHCGLFVGLDHSRDMAARCRERLDEAGLGTDRARVEIADISRFHLPERFDLIVAPFRVFQSLETDEQVEGVFRGIREHLAPEGRCILNTFRPLGSAAQLVAKWAARDETESWSVPTVDGRIVCVDRRAGIRSEPLTLYPEHVYRRYRGSELVEESVLPIVMRCYYPDELLDRIRSEGFEVTAKWGGYAGQVYGDGPELVVEFGWR